jgi:hypothetical protein
MSADVEYLLKGRESSKGPAAVLSIIRKYSEKNAD